MVRPILFYFFVLITSSSVGQETVTIPGTWRVIGLNNGVSCDFRNDSCFVTKKLSDSLRGQSDSTVYVEVLNAFIARYREYQFVFGVEGNYKEIKAGKLRVSGTYKLDPDTRSIDVLYATDQGGRSHKFRYEHESGILKLFVKSPPGDDLEIFLEKQQ